MKKLILVFFILLPLTVQAGWICKDQETVPAKFMLIDPVEGIDYVFKIDQSDIKQVGIINYFTFEITHLKRSLRVKSKQSAGSESDPPDQRRKILDDMIRETWPGVGRIKYFKQ